MSQRIVKLTDAKGHNYYNVEYLGRVKDLCAALVWFFIPIIGWWALLEDDVGNPFKKRWRCDRQFDTLREAKYYLKEGEDMSIIVEEEVIMEEMPQWTKNVNV